MKGRAATLLERINTLNEQAKYAEAIPLARDLLGVVEKQRDASPLAIVSCLNVLGGLCNSFGDYSQAETYIRRAVEIAERLDKASSNTANSLGLLAQIHMNQENYVAAEPAAKRSLAIREKLSGKDDLMVSTSLNTLGEIYLHLRQYDKAEPLLMRAVDIRRKHSHPHALVITLNILSQLYYEIRDYAAAEAIAASAVELGRGSLDPNHPHLADALNILGRVEAALGRFDAAYDHMRSAQGLHLVAIDNMKGFTSEEQKLRFLNKIDGDYQAFLSLVCSRFPDDSRIVGETLGIVFKRKGIVLEIQRRFQEALFSRQSSGLETFHELSAIRANLSKLSFSDEGDERPADTRAKMRLLSQQKEQLERRLSGLSGSFSLEMELARADCANVQDALPKGSVLVEFVRVRPYDFGKDSRNRWGEYRYIAFLLNNTADRNVRIVTIGDAGAIDERIASLRDKIANTASASYNSVSETSHALYKTLFAPLEGKLGGLQSIYISPDGNLNLLPFEVLQKPDGSFLIDRFVFTYLPCGRDLLRFGRNPGKPVKSVILGNPDFDLAGGKGRASTGTGPNRGSSNLETVHLQRMSFKPLPMAGQEATEVFGLLGKDRAELYLGERAGKDVLFGLEDPRFLHLATHAFFLGQTSTPSSAKGRGLVVTGTQQPARDPAPGGENPLLQAGLALAGANKELSRGIVTAEEVLNLRLRGTEMVVLSACTTGVGEVRAGNGVWGLRMAFVQVGARSLVTSMWSVPDLETKELMVRFYENMITRGMPRSKALHESIVEQKKAVGKRYGAPHPFYWGGFIFAGEP